MLPTMEDALIVLVVAIVAFACSVVVRVRNTLEQRLPVPLDLFSTTRASTWMSRLLAALLGIDERRLYVVFVHRVAQAFHDRYRRRSGIHSAPLPLLPPAQHAMPWSMLEVSETDKQATTAPNRQRSMPPNVDYWNVAGGNCSLKW
jgi:hypothetical protein